MTFKRFNLACNPRVSVRRHVCEHGQRRLRHPQGLGGAFVRGHAICKYYNSHSSSIHTFLTPPWAPDPLCTQCVAALNALFYNHDQVFQLGPSQDSNGCRLCALLLARFRATATASLLEIECRMVPRWNNFVRPAPLDIVFRPVGVKDWVTNVVTLGIQKKKRDPSQSIGSIPSE